MRRFDLILCRNVLSYFEPPVREQVLAHLLPSLAPGGYLVLGAGEAPPPGFEGVGAGVFRLAGERERAVA